ncbi:MAG: CCA tRNA nucleotidyltransferase [Bdellovibrionales bacterium]|nr:CCA tRNA nucleotidyltransferase [Bdellovibrionales bacterium]
MENRLKWTRTERAMPLPEAVRETLSKLDDAGFVGFLVGGCVRDFLLSRPTKDYDIATNALPDELEKIFPNALEVGKAFGVLKIPSSNSGLLEVATFREDLEYKDHRHPVGVKFSGPEEDARRRDFTVNALFYDPKTQRILDSVGGLEDLKSKTLRAIGDPAVRFKEDALRLLRAVRFTHALGFHLDASTQAAAKTQARLIQKISQERIREEMTRMLQGPHPANAVKMLSDLDLLFYVLPEVEVLKKTEQPTYVKRNLWLHTLSVLEICSNQNPKRSVALSWAALLQEIGKPIAWRKSGEKSFVGHDREAAMAAEKIGERLKFSREEIDRLVILVRDHLKLREVFHMREATLQRLIREPAFEELLALHRAAASATDGNHACWEFARSRYLEYLKSPPPDAAKIITGEDLIHLGLTPGPRFSEILRTVEDQVLERQITTKEQALDYVLKHFVK